ncbi:MAG: DUF881 domain-containing protein [Candidatus Cryosericum sp.]|jgi:uncharacterized protein YlxW (UPF0749 family)|nr:DUF881 domain-containing protein [Candidatus Cryosericum sp.]HPS69605.1 DUF881 domain-containing protein [Candidatus Cryosericum sp.]
MRKQATSSLRSIVIIFGLISLFVGFLLPGQARVVREMKQSYQNEDPKDLIRVIKDLQQRKAELSGEQQELTQKVDQYIRASDDTAAQVKQLEGEIAVLRQRMGATALEGPGIRVTLTEQSSGATPSILADEDLLLLLSDLWASGAEAISLNGIRLTDTTSVYRAGLNIRVGDKVTNMPLVIDAIGDAENMSKGLQIPGGALDLLNLRRISAIVQKVNPISIK